MINFNYPFYWHKGGFLMFVKKDTDYYSYYVDKFKIIRYEDVSRILEHRSFIKEINIDNILFQEYDISKGLPTKMIRELLLGPL